MSHLGLKSIRVLLVEDDEDDALLMKEMIKRAGKGQFKIEHTHSLAGALNCLGNGGFNVILADLNLPDSHGIDTFLELQTHSFGTPVMVLTGLDDEKMAVGAVIAGAQDYLIKDQVTGALLTRAMQYAIERRRLNETLQASELMFRNLMENNADAIVVVGPDRIIQFANPAVETMLGVKATEFVGSTFSYPISDGDKSELEVMSGDGTPITVEMRVTKTRWGSGISLLASLRDITSHKTMLDTLDRTRLEQIELKDQFLSHVSHELRSPLAIIHQYVTILIDGLAGDLSGEQVAHLATVLRNVSELTRLVDDLLLVTSSRSGKLVANPEPVTLARHVHEVLESFGPIASKGGISLSSALAPGLPVVFADPERLQQVLTNLLGNAIKFTPQDGRIHVAARVLEGDDSSVLVSISDTGCGISVDDVDRIFNRLDQVPIPTNVGHRGLGLGLYICRELVALHDGKIWVESKQGVGSTFFFTLPVFNISNHIESSLSKIFNSAESFSLITVEITPTRDGAPEEVGNATMSRVRVALRKAILPDRDVLLPKMLCRRRGEILFLVVSSEEASAGSIAERLKKSIENGPAPQRMGFTLRVSAREHDLQPRLGGGTLDEFVREVAAQISETAGEPAVIS